MGQPSFAFLASSSNFSFSAPGMRALVVRWILVMVGPSSAISMVTTAVGLEGVRGELGVGELRAKGHGEAAGVGGGDELFGVGAGAIFKARMEAVGRCRGGCCSEWKGCRCRL